MHPLLQLVMVSVAVSKTVVAPPEAEKEDMLGVVAVVDQVAESTRLLEDSEP